MSAPELSQPEFPRMLDRRGLTAEPVELTANETECAALATRFGIQSVKRLKASVTLEANGVEVRAHGTLSARIMQSCAVSGDDLPQSINEKFTLRFVPEADWADLTVEEVELEADELDAIPYDGKTFDLGEAVAQSLALAIDPFATGPDADTVRERHDLANNTPSGPLAEALAALKKN